MFVSSDGARLVEVARGRTGDLALELPARVASFRYVVIADVSHPAVDRRIDGFDLDGVAAPYARCAGSLVEPGGEVLGAGDRSAGPVHGLLDPLRQPTFATCRIPQLAGRTVGDATRILVARQCAVRKVVERSSSAPPGLVVRKVPPAGSRRPWRKRVVVVVSRGPRAG